MVEQLVFVVVDYVPFEDYAVPTFEEVFDTYEDAKEFADANGFVVLERGLA